MGKKCQLCAFRSTRPWGRPRRFKTQKADDILQLYNLENLTECLRAARMENAMIQVCNLTLQYPNGKGIRDISFRVKEGEVLGYLGPNGAGKTTTIRCLLGFSRRTLEAVLSEGWTAAGRPLPFSAFWAIFPARSPFWMA